MDSFGSPRRAYFVDYTKYTFRNPDRNITVPIIGMQNLYLIDQTQTKVVQDQVQSTTIRYLSGMSPFWSGRPQGGSLCQYQKTWEFLSEFNRKFRVSGFYSLVIPWCVKVKQ